MKITPYISDILEQPAALDRCLTRLAQRPALNEFQTHLKSKRYRRIILTGMGSSYFAAIPLQYRLLRSGYETYLLETSELIYNLPELIEPSSLFVVISQSGQSTETIRLLQLANGCADIIGVTNGESSPLVVQSRASLLIHAGTENTVSCKTYINTLAALTALGDDLTDHKGQLASLSAAPQALQLYLDRWIEHVTFLAREMKIGDQLFLLGRGVSLAAAQTGGLIIKEAARFPAQAMSTAAFRHGPIELVSSHIRVLVYAGLPGLHEVNHRLVQDIQQFGGAANLIAENAAIPVFALPKISSAALPLVEILLPQMLSLALAEQSGHEAGTFRFASKVTTIQ